MSVAEGGDEIAKVIDNPSRQTTQTWSTNLQRYYYKQEALTTARSISIKTKSEVMCEFRGEAASCQMCSRIKAESAWKSGER